MKVPLVGDVEQKKIVLTKLSRRTKVLAYGCDGSDNIGRRFVIENFVFQGSRLDRLDWISVICLPVAVATMELMITFRLRHKKSSRAVDSPKVQLLPSLANRYSLPLK